MSSINIKIILQIISILILGALCILGQLYINRLGQPYIKKYPSANQQGSRYVRAEIFNPQKTSPLKNKASFKAMLPGKNGWDLSTKDYIPDDQALLYLSKTPHPHNFFLMNTHISYDIIWINQNKILDVDKNISPPYSHQSPDSIKRNSPRGDIDKFLVIKGGLAEKYQIEVGDILYLDLDYKPE